MRTLVLKILVLLGLCAAVVLWCDCDTKNIARPIDDNFSLVPTQLDLDTAFIGVRAAEGDLVMTNLRLSFLYFYGFEGDCPEGITWSPPADTLEAGESVTLELRFEPEDAFEPDLCVLRILAESPNASTDSEKTVTVNYAAGEAECDLSPGPDLEFGEVGVGSRGDVTLTLGNATLDPIDGNRFRYEFRSPSGNCGLFALDPADSSGVIGPGGSKDILVRFAPAAPGDFECRRELVSLRVSEDPNPPSITRACPSEVVWKGTGAVPAAQWSPCLPGGGKDWHGIFGLSGSDVHAVGDGGSVISSAGDCQWQASGTGFTNVGLRDIWGGASGADTVLWAVGNIPPGQGLFQETGAILTRNGPFWTKEDEDGFHTYAAVWGSGLDDVYFTGAGVATDFPNAKHWDGTLGTLQISPYGMSTVTGVSGTGSADVWAVLEQSFNSVYRFQGGQWEDQTQAFMTQPPYDVWAIQGTEFYAVYVVGADGAIYHYDGSDWSDESIAGESRDFYGVWVSATGQAFVVGEGQAIYRGHVNDPAGWTLLSPPSGLPAGDLMGVWGTADDDVYAVGTNGVIIRYWTGG